VEKLIKQECVQTQIGVGLPKILAENKWHTNMHKLLLNYLHAFAIAGTE